jgi:hypothetical protein
MTMFNKITSGVCGILFGIAITMMVREFGQSNAMMQWRNTPPYWVGEFSREMEEKIDAMPIEFLIDMPGIARLNGSFNVTIRIGEFDREINDIIVNEHSLRDAMTWPEWKWLRDRVDNHLREERQCRIRNGNQMPMKCGKWGGSPVPMPWKE